jgi:hypothetical protein
MKTGILLALLLLVLAPAVVVHAADIIVYTANQEWLSRIYLLRMDGTVLNYFEYEFYRFVGMEVVNNELYVAEAFAPRVYKVDLHTGGLDVFIDDWSLYYFYDLAFDGTYFYVDEWDLNRYDVNGNKDGMASFDEYVLGCAWDGSHFWTLDDYNLIKCWDISSWPTIIPVPDNHFAPPSPESRGLWFDGIHFWTAESKDDILGKIYKFNHGGQVVQEWTEPAFSGWAACVILDFLPESVVLSADLSEEELVLCWTTCSGAAAYWIYGADNDADFEPGFAPGYTHRLAVLSDSTIDWASSHGIGDPQHNWTYLVVVVNSSQHLTGRESLM